MEIELEIWKSVPINNFNHYEISNNGRFRRKISDDKYKLIQGTTKKEYITVSLSNGKYRMETSLHKLVLLGFQGEALFENAQVNHKNGNKHDNRLINLEWVTGSDNIKHAFNSGLMIKNGNFGNKKKINLIDNDGKIIETFASSVEAGKKMNCDPSGIIKVCKGKMTSVKNLIFKYSDEEFKEEIDISEFTTISGYSQYLINNVGDIIIKKSHKKINANLHDNKILRISLIGDDGKRHSEYIHRLVALTYICNPENKPNIYHIDGNLMNNNIKNLKWVSNSDTILKANRKSTIKVTSRSIYQIMSNKIIAQYESINQAAEKIGIVREAIDNCLRGITKTSGGFEWKYADEITHDGEATVNLEKSDEPIFIKKCNYIFKKGIRKGEICGIKFRIDGSLCSRHK